LLTDVSAGGKRRLRWTLAAKAAFRMGKSGVSDGCSTRTPSAVGARRPPAFGAFRSAFASSLQPRVGPMALNAANVESGTISMPTLGSTGLFGWIL